MSSTHVDRLYDELAAIKAHLLKSDEISLQSSADDNFKKTLLLAAASYFDTRLRELLLEFFHDLSKNSRVFADFAQNTTINSRKYHLLFEWDSKNVHSFYKLFGEDFVKYMNEIERCDPTFSESAIAFLEIGRERNRLVHQNFASYTIEKDAAEIYAIYKKANMFVEGICNKLRHFTGLAVVPDIKDETTKA